MLYMVKFTINIHPMLVYIPYMDPMGNIFMKFFLMNQKPTKQQELKSRPPKKRDHPLKVKTNRKAS